MPILVDHIHITKTNTENTDNKPKPPIRLISTYYNSALDKEMVHEDSWMLIWTPSDLVPANYDLAASVGNLRLIYTCCFYQDKQLNYRSANQSPSINYINLSGGDSFYIDH